MKIACLSGVMAMDLLDLVIDTTFDECKGYEVSRAVFPNFLSLYAT
jgi:hypothetical protein